MADKLNFLNNKIKKNKPYAPSPFSNNHTEPTKTVRLRQSLYKKIKIKAAVHDDSITDIIGKAVRYAEKHDVI